MTQKLKDLMDDAADLEFAPVDLDAVVRAGDRTVRRRRGMTGLVALGTAAVVGAVAYAGLPGGGDDDSRAEVLSTVERPVSYTLGSVLHTPEGDRDLGHEVAAYLDTDAGIVFADPKGSVYADTGDGVERIGATTARHQHLVADGSLAGWIDVSGEKPAFVVHDLDSGTELVRDSGHTAPGQATLSDEEDPAYFYGIDGREAFWRDARGAVAVDVDSGEARVVDPTALNGFDIIAVKDGLIASRAEQEDPMEDGGAGGTRISSGMTGGVVIPEAYGSQASFSPDALWITVDADEPQVYDVASGELVPLDVDGRFFATGYQWLDADTLAVIAARTETSPVELLSCEIPAGTCAVALELGTFEELESAGFNLPVGE